MRYCLFILVVFNSFISFGQASKPDTFSVVNGDKILIPFERKYIQYTETKEGLISFNSILTRKLEKVQVEGRDNWLIIQSYQSNKSIDKDSSFCELTTLKPVAYFSDVASEGHKEKVTFLKNSISNKTLYKDSSATIIKENTGRYNGVMSDEIISCLPLKLNASFAIKTVNPGLRYFEYTTDVTVEGKEEIEIAGLGKILCWKLRTGKGRNSSLEWYSVNGQVQVKKKFEFGNGSVFYRVLLAG